MRTIALDTESTARDGQICQLAYLVIDGDAIEGKNLYFSVDSMSDAAQNVHGLSLSALNTLSGGERFADRAAEILADFASADMLIGHNISADMRMLHMEMQRAGLSLPPTATLCTMQRFTPILKLKRPRGPGSPKPPRLDELCSHYAVTPAIVSAHCRRWFGSECSAHDARFDAAATYLSLCAAMEKSDITL